MSATFGSNYADIYDRMYAAKDYARECDLIVSAAGSSDDLRILDMGCGTGGHALTLARLGHTVTGVDVSREMLRVATAKST